MSKEQEVRAAFANQVAYCAANDAPVTGRICEAAIAMLDDSTAFGRRVLEWQGKPLADALPLRVAGGFHALHLSGAEPAFSPLYAGEATAMAAAERLLASALKRHEAKLLPWLDGPPQTNEAGRSANFVAAMLWLVKQGLSKRFECIEIGSSAGINLMMDRYHYDLVGETFGPENAEIRFKPEWRGNPPPSGSIAIKSLCGCDISPVDLTDEAQAMRLKAYIWPEHKLRFKRFEAAIKEAHIDTPNLVQADAAEFVETQLKTLKKPDTTRLLMHSIVWQYLPDATRDRITASMAAAGAKASPKKPLAWITLESNRGNYRHELQVKYWNGETDNPEWHPLGTSHAHGAWIEWMAK